MKTSNLHLALAVVIAVALAPVTPAIAQPVFSVDTIRTGPGVVMTQSPPLQLGESLKPAMTFEMFGAFPTPFPVLTIETNGQLSFGTPMSSVNFNAGASEAVEQTGVLPVAGYIVVRLSGQPVLIPYSHPPVALQIDQPGIYGWQNQK